MDEPVRGPSVVCSGFIEREGQFLLVFCPGLKVWRVPGGRAEWNETLENAFAREMFEEIGVSVKNPVFFGLWARSSVSRSCRERDLKTPHVLSCQNSRRT